MVDFPFDWKNGGCPRSAVVLDDFPLPFNFWIVLQTHPTVNKSSIHSNSIAIDIQTVPCAPGGKTTRGDEHRRGGTSFFTFWIGILIKILNNRCWCILCFWRNPGIQIVNQLPLFFWFIIGVFTGYILLTSGGWPFRWFKPTCIWDDLNGWHLWFFSGQSSIALWTSRFERYAGYTTFAHNIPELVVVFPHNPNNISILMYSPKSYEWQISHHWHPISIHQSPF